MKLRDLTPPILWNWVRQRRHGEEVRYAGRRYHVMQTDYSAVPLHVGRYAEIFERIAPTDPHFDLELTRYRTYNICQAARWSLRVPGDFLCVGVSFGIAPRVVFEYTDLQADGRTYHLVDPFTVGGVFNTDSDSVRRRFPPEAKVVIRQGFAPEAIPDVPLAFAHFDTGHADAEAASLPTVYRRLAPGGIVIFDAFSSTSGATREYQRALTSMNLEPFWLPSGQIMVAKR